MPTPPFVSHLPFPHGSGTGQIANGNNYDDNDTPGYPGGRFIGFGENATSAITNRSAWALSSNIDYIYQKYSSVIAVPQVDKFTSTGTSSYHLSTLVFCGDSNYPPAESEGLMLLFSVLDAQYNALIDVHGNEVRVSHVLETTDVDSAYGAAFVQSPWVHFYTVDPKTGAVVSDPYPIPAAQVVRIAYGIASSLESLSVDAFTKYKVMSGEEVPAGVLLLDGSLPMTEDLNLGSHDLLACTGISNGGHGPVRAPEGFDGFRTGSLFNFANIGLKPVNGAFPNIYMLVASETEFDIELQYDPSGVVPGQALLALYDSVNDVSLTLALDAASRAFMPLYGVLLDLGSVFNPWSNLYSNTLWANTLNLSTDQMYVDSERIDGPYKVPLFSRDDYYFKEDFAMHASYDTPGTAVGDWLWFDESNMSTMDPSTEPTFGRVTVKTITVAPTTGSYVILHGPEFLSPNDLKLHARVGFAMPALSELFGESYTVRLGFNVTATLATDPCAFLEVGLNGQMTFVCCDGSTITNTDMGYASTDWLDVEIIFQAIAVQINVNGSTESVPLAAPNLSLWSFTAFRIDKVGGTNTSAAIIDYAELYSEGHVLRPLST